MTTELDPNKNRIGYCDAITPPNDYEVMYAIGTTYSLDLDALLAVCLSIGLDVDVDNSAVKNPICLLNSLRKLVGKLVVFCEQGQIKSINKKNEKAKLYSILDQIIVPITIEPNIQNKDFYPAFHSKTWTIVYRKKSQPTELLYRFVVLSRNLTFDRSWDTVICLYGKKNTHEIKIDNEENKKVINFLNYISNQINYLNGQNQFDYKDRIDIIENVISELDNVSFSLEENPKKSNKNNNFEILPFFSDLTNHDNRSNEFEKEKIRTMFDVFKKIIKGKGENLLIISPFLSPEIIQDLGNKKNNCILITRETEITKIIDYLEKKPNSLDNYDPYNQKEGDYKKGIYIIREEAFCQKDDLNQNEDESWVPSVCHLDIHAKLFVTDNLMCTGSLNATEAALYRNTEMMVKVFETGIYESILKSLFQVIEDKNSVSSKYVKSIFKKIDISKYQNNEDLKELAQDKNKELEPILKNFLRCNLSAKIECDSENTNKYKVTLKYEIPENFKDKLNDISITISLITTAPQAIMFDYQEITFCNLDVSKLSELYSITITKNDNIKINRVISIPTSFLNLRDRNDEIFKSILDTPEKILQYIDLQLSDCFDRSSILHQITNIHSSNTTNDSYKITNGLYEKLLRNLCDKQQINEISTIETICKDKTSDPKYEKIAKFCNVFSSISSTFQQQHNNGITNE